MAYVVRNGDSGSSVTIASSGTTSTVFDARGGITWGIKTPAAITGANIAVEVSNVADSGFVDLYKLDGNAASFAVSASSAYTLPSELAPWPYFRLVSDGAEAAEREIIVVDKG